MYTATNDDSVHPLKNSSQNYQDAAEQAKSDLKSAAKGAGRKVRDMIDTASDEITHAKETVTTQIRTNPVQSSMVALGVGFVLGVLFRR